jgi:hypothetical protein
MPGPDAWIYDLVVAGYVSIADLKRPGVDLLDLIKLSDAHLIDLENQIRLKEYQNRDKD